MPFTRSTVNFINWLDRQINSTIVMRHIRSPSSIFIGFQISVKGWKNIFSCDLPFSRYSQTVEPHISHLWTRVNCTHSGSDKVRMSPNACLIVCNFHGCFSGILFRLNGRLWTPQWLFCLMTLVLCHSSGEWNFVGNMRPRT